jgi:hypothetical protein
MATGGGLILAGTALIIAGWWSDDSICSTRYVYGGGYQTTYYGDGWCGNRALAIAGATTTLIGLASLGIGIPVYIGGNADVRRARWLRRQLTIAPMLRPNAGSFHAGGAVALGF